MMDLSGYANRVARVDLTSGAVKYEGINPDDARKYIGGRGLGVKYVFDNGPNVDAMSPDNILSFTNGPLTGSAVNMSGRLAVCTKSPLTGTVTDSHMGGWSAARLRWSGFDAVIFKGKADKPVYAVAKNGEITLHDASDLWGKSTRETVKLLQERHGGKEVSVMAIGPAGENGVKYAAILNEHDRASGRGGTGCVMGTKMLKALVAIGDIKSQWKPKSESKAAFEEARKVGLKAIMEGALTAPRKGGLSLYGTNVLTNIINEIGALPTRNGQTTSHPQAELISGEYIREHYLVEEPTCHACPVACKKLVEIKEGPYAGVRTESFEYESAWAIAVNCDHADAGAVAKVLDLCNDYGMDTIEIGNVFSTAMEATEKGFLKIDGGIQWGDHARQVELAAQIAMQSTELGKVLGKGAYGAAKEMGCPELANSVKGQAIPAYDPRGIKGIGLGYATSNRGACHQTGHDLAAQSFYTVDNSLVICRFVRGAAGGLEYYPAVLNAITGWNVSKEEFLEFGDRIWNLERSYMGIQGFRRQDDYLRDRVHDDALTVGPHKGAKLDRADWKKYLEAYYAERKWDAAKALPTPEKLKALKLDEAADVVAKLP